jgi:hypothetical protein
MLLTIQDVRDSIDGVESSDIYFGFTASTASISTEI